MSDLSTLEHVDTSTAPKVQEPGDHELFAHYAGKVALDAAMFSGVPVTALCGKTWLPSKDPKRYPVCPTCKEVYEQMQPGDPENPDYGK